MDLLARLLPSMVVIIGALLVLRRWGRRGVRPETAVRVVGRTGVTRGAVVAIVEVGAQRYLVGAGEDGVRLLAELEAAPQAALEGPLTQAAPHPVPASPQQAPPKPRGLRPWSSLVHRLQQMTVRTHVEATVRENL